MIKSLRNFTKWLGIQGPIDKILWPSPKVKVTRSQKAKIVLQITPFKIVAESRDKNYYVCRLFTSLNISEHDYGRRTDSFKDR